MAGDWIKMRNELWDHPKVVRILSAICPQNVRDMSARCRVIGALFRTWSLADQYTTDGIIDGYDAEALNLLVGIEGWAENLQHVGWLVIEAQRLIVPDFADHNGESAKRRAEDSKRKKTVRKMSAKCPQSSGQNADQIREKIRDKREDTKTIAAAENGKVKDNTSEAIQAVLAHYQTIHPKALCPSGSKTWKKIRDRLKEGYSVDDLTKAINGNHRSPHHCGQNDTKTKYQSLELICRDAEHVQKFIEFCSGDATFKQRVYEPAIDGPYNPNG